MQSENYKQMNFTEGSTLKRFEELTINQFRTKKKIKMVYFYKIFIKTEKLHKQEQCCHVERPQ